MQNIICPKTAEDVREAIEWAVASETPLAVQGHGSKQSYGRPVHAEHRLDLSELNGIIDYEPEELVLTVKPGTPIADVEALVRQHNQELSFEPMDLGPLLGLAPQKGTIGGVLSCNLAGPRRLKFGAARDHILGLEGVSGRAEIFKAGGRVVKNVTGYDLPRAFCGSLGTLAVATSITLKVNPRSESTATFCLHGLSEAAAVEALCRAMGSSAEVSGAAHLPDGLEAGQEAMTILRLEGFPVSIDYRFEILRKILEELGPAERIGEERSLALWQQVRDCRMIAASESPVWKVSVPPASGAAYLAKLRETCDVTAFLDWSGGLIWLRCDDGQAHEKDVRGALTGAGGGHAALVRASADLREQTTVFQPQPAPLAALSARLKQQFDPAGILNPGRMVPAAGATNPQTVGA